jgi:hypothetical protein
METADRVQGRKDSETRLRQRPITFWVPDPEAEELIAAAELAGRSLGSYIRSRLFTPPQTAPRERQALDVALTALRADMERVGRDIHELLRWVRFGHSPLAEEFRAAFADYRKVARAIRQALRGKPDAGRRRA